METKEKSTSPENEKPKKAELKKTEPEEQILDDSIQDNPPLSNSGKNFLPLAIIIAGVFVGAGIFGGMVYYTKQTVKIAGGPEELADFGGKIAGAATVNKISETDYFLGSADAEVKLIEFSDLDCPYCQAVHKTFQKLIQNYRPQELVWVYRHFPLSSIHPFAARKSEASECAGDLGGQEIFWKYLDLLFDNQRNVQTDQGLAELAGRLGLDKSQFQSCLDSNKFRDKIEAQFNEAVAAGGRGTPYTIIVKNNQYIPISGALPMETFQKQIDSLLK